MNIENFLCVYILKGIPSFGEMRKQKFLKVVHRNDKISLS